MRSWESLEVASRALNEIPECLGAEAEVQSTLSLILTQLALYLNMKTNNAFKKK